VFVIH